MSKPNITEHSTNAPGNTPKDTGEATPSSKLPLTGNIMTGALLIPAAISLMDKLLAQGAY